VADKPTGPFVDPLHHPLVKDSPHGAEPIDPMVFIDHSGQAYLYFGGHAHCVVGKLGKDMTSVEGEWTDVTPAGYIEGVFMFERQGIYYLGWSEGNWMNSTYKVCYATGTTPVGPFVSHGPLLVCDPAVATGAGHHSVIQIPGSDEWYIVYHRRPLNERFDHRTVCIERFTFKDDGLISPATTTRQGVGTRPLEPIKADPQP